MTRILALAVIASAGCGAKNATTITTHGVVVTIPHGDAIRVVSAADEAGFRYEEDDREIAFRFGAGEIPATAGWTVTDDGARARWEGPEGVVAELTCAPATERAWCDDVLARLQVAPAPAHARQVQTRTR